MRITMGGIFIKRIMPAITAFIILTLLSGCGTSGSKNQSRVAAEVTESSTAVKSNMSGITTGNETTVTDSQNSTISDTTAAGDKDNTNSAKEQLLQSASIDLDNDDISEQVEAVQVIVNGETENTDELVGKLIIKSGTTEAKETSLTFGKKAAGTSGILTSIQFEDLDGDGAKDVFIIIPDNGASFSYSNYYIYSYKKNINYSFMNNSEMNDFIDGFSFKQEKGNTLSLINEIYDFSADFTIEPENGQKLSGEPENSQTSNEYMKEYEQRAWIEPVSVDISEDSRMSLTKGTDGAREIKVPLPVFGLATVDMIGEIDLYFSVDNSFNPVLKHFDVLDFKWNDKMKIGSCSVQ